MNIKSESIISDLDSIRDTKPLILNITNYVSAGWVANGLLALSAAPVMSQVRSEIEELTEIAQSIVLNIGTLDEESFEVMKLSLLIAKSKGIPVVLDPVGAGATSFRTKSALELLSQGGISVVRGNPSEISALAGESYTTRGVETSLLPAQACDSARKLSDLFGCVVVASGPDDAIVGDNRTVRIYNGTSLMTRVTGMGCLVSAMIAAFAAVQKDTVLASAHAMAYACIAGEKAALDTPGLGSYKVAYLDALTSLSMESVSKLLTVECYATSISS